MTLPYRRIYLRRSQPWFHCQFFTVVLEFLREDIRTDMVNVLGEFLKRTEKHVWKSLGEHVGAVLHEYSKKN
jgi:hypothetical protein